MCGGQSAGAQSRTEKGGHGIWWPGQMENYQHRDSSQMARKDGKHTGQECIEIIAMVGGAKYEMAE